MINEISICEYMKNRTDDSDDILVDIREKMMYEFRFDSRQQSIFQ